MPTLIMLLAVAASLLLLTRPSALGQEIENRSGADMTVLLVRRMGWSVGGTSEPAANRLSVDLKECSIVDDLGAELVLDCSEPLTRSVAREKPEIAAPLLGAFTVKASRAPTGALESKNTCEILVFESLVAATAFNAARGLGFYYGGVTHTAFRDALVEVGRGVRVDGVPVIRHRFIAPAFCVADPDWVQPQERDLRYEFKPYLEYVKDSGRLLRLWEERRSNYALSLSGQTSFDRGAELLR